MAMCAHNANQNDPVSRNMIPNALDYSSIDDSSAAQPAPKSDLSAHFRSLPECNNWLQAPPSQEMLQNKPLQQVHKAIAVLQGRSCRQQRKDVKQLLKPWDVVQTTQGRKRKFDEVNTDLAEKVVEETRRLKECRHDPDSGNMIPNALDSSSI